MFTNFFFLCEYTLLTVIKLVICSETFFYFKAKLIKNTMVRSNFFSVKLAYSQYKAQTKNIKFKIVRDQIKNTVSKTFKVI